MWTPDGQRKCVYNSYVPQMEQQSMQGVLLIKFQPCKRLCIQKWCKGVSLLISAKGVSLGCSEVKWSTYLPSTRVVRWLLENCCCNQSLSGQLNELIPFDSVQYQTCNLILLLRCLIGKWEKIARSLKKADLNIELIPGLNGKTHRGSAPGEIQDLFHWWDIQIDLSWIHLLSILNTEFVKNICWSRMDLNKGQDQTARCDRINVYCWINGCLHSRQNSKDIHESRGYMDIHHWRKIHHREPEQWWIERGCIHTPWLALAATLNKQMSAQVDHMNFNQ